MRWRFKKSIEYYLISTLQDRTTIALDILTLVAEDTTKAALRWPFTIFKSWTVFSTLVEQDTTIGQTNLTLVTQTPALPIWSGHLLLRCLHNKRPILIHNRLNAFVWKSKFGLNTPGEASYWNCTGCWVVGAYLCYLHSPIFILAECGH